MKIVLLQDYEALGKKGKVLQIRNGYARNYLIPKGIAKEATDKVLKELEQERLLEEKKKERHLQKLEDLKRRLSQVSITIGAKVGQDRMYGAITNLDIARALKEEGYEIDRHAIILDEPIKELGVYKIPIRLHSNIEAKIKVWIVKE